MRVLVLFQQLFHDGAPEHHEKDGHQNGLRLHHHLRLVWSQAHQHCHVQGKDEHLTASSNDHQVVARELDGCIRKQVPQQCVHEENPTVREKVAICFGRPGVFVREPLLRLCDRKALLESILTKLLLLRLRFFQWAASCTATQHVPGPSEVLFLLQLLGRHVKGSHSANVLHHSLADLFAVASLPKSRDLHHCDVEGNGAAVPGSLLPLVAAPNAIYQPAEASAKHQHGCGATGQHRDKGAVGEATVNAPHICKDVDPVAHVDAGKWDENGVQVEW
mmetsp:Transcript_12149/g.29032  ORF Transcript_12149/g.29032 Transcript_12149/m.29032 type:complete len:276 (-) Transcript_12149:68-895(-)